MDWVNTALAWKHGVTPGVTLSQHRRHGYLSPDAVYEGALLRLVQPGTRWLDAGGGASPCPHNPGLARHLADTCAELVGVDPGPNLARNPFVHRAQPSAIEQADGVYDLVTMRMVAEHVANPAGLAVALRRLVRPGGTLLIYTVHAWSPTVLAARVLPAVARRLGMRWLCAGQDRDVFPAHYRLNTVAQLEATLAGFTLVRADALDDCRTTLRWPRLHDAELRLRTAFRQVGLAYPESCILAEFNRDA